jgi:hypothetical protein
MSDEPYLCAHIQRLLTEDGGLAEQGIAIECEGDRVALRGEVESDRRRTQIEQVVTAHLAEHGGGRSVQNEIRVVPVSAPAAAEEVAIRGEPT